MMSTDAFDKIISNAFRVQHDAVAQVQGDIRIRMEEQARAAGTHPKPWPDMSFVEGGITGAKRRYDYARIYQLSDEGMTARQISELIGASVNQVRSIRRDRRLSAKPEQSA